MRNYFVVGFSILLLAFITGMLLPTTNQIWAKGKGGDDINTVTSPPPGNVKASSGGGNDKNTVLHAVGDIKINSGGGNDENRPNTESGNVKINRRRK